MNAPPSSKHPGHREQKIGEEFYKRQRVVVRCGHCGASQDGLHPDDASAWFAAHRRSRHPDLATVKKRGRLVTKSTYQYQRRFQDEEELAFRDSRRFIHTIGRT